MGKKQNPDTTFHPVPLAEGWRVGVGTRREGKKAVTMIHAVVGWSTENGVPHPVYATQHGLQVFTKHSYVNLDTGYSSVRLLLAPGEYPDDDKDVKGLLKMYLDTYVKAAQKKARRAARKAAE